MPWKSPTPHEESLARIDDYVVNHKLSPVEAGNCLRYFDGDKRAYGLRHLRFTAAVNRIRALSNKLPLDLL